MFFLMKNENVFQYLFFRPLKPSYLIKMLLNLIIMLIPKYLSRVIAWCKEMVLPFVRKFSPFFLKCRISYSGIFNWDFAKFGHTT